MRSPTRQGGFTLLELLLAMTMSATIAGSLAASLYIAYRARNSATAAVEGTHLFSAIGDIVARDLGNALPPTGQYAGSFLGDAQTIEFFASGSEGKGTVQGDCRRITYSLNDSTPGSGAMLVRRVATNLEPPVELESVNEPILRKVQSLVFRYFDGTDWYDSWDSSAQNNSAPTAVELTVTLLPASNGQVQSTTRIIPIPCGVAP